MINLTREQWALLTRAGRVRWFCASKLDDQAECVELWSMNLLELQLRGSRAGYAITERGTELVAALERSRFALP